MGALLFGIGTVIVAKSGCIETGAQWQERTCQRKSILYCDAFHLIFALTNARIDLSQKIVAVNKKRQLYSIGAVIGSCCSLIVILWFQVWLCLKNHCLNTQTMMKAATKTMYHLDWSLCWKRFASIMTCCTDRYSDSNTYNPSAA